MHIFCEVASSAIYVCMRKPGEGNPMIQANLLKRYVRLRPDQATAFDQLGHVLEDEHQESEAIVAWRRSILLNPRYSEAIYSFALVLKRTNPVESKQLMDRVHELEHDQQTIDRVNMLGNQANEKMYEAKYKGAIDDLNNAIVQCGRCKLL